MRAPKLLSRLFSSGLGVADESSGRMVLSAFFSRGRVGMPSISMMPLNRLTFCEPKASRIEPAMILSFALSCVEDATSITKNASSRPMRSANVTNQP